MSRNIMTDQAVINDVLDRAEVLYLALCDKDGPYSVPVNFARDDRCLYIHSGLRGRKVEAIRRHGRISFSACVDLKLKRADEACKHGYLFKSVIGMGNARFLDDEAQCQNALNTIIKKYADGDSPVDEKTLKRTALIEIEILSVTARVNE